MNRPVCYTLLYHINRLVRARVNVWMSHGLAEASNCNSVLYYYVVTQRVVYRDISYGGLLHIGLLFSRPYLKGCVRTMHSRHSTEC